MLRTLFLAVAVACVQVPRAAEAGPWSRIASLPGGAASSFVFDSKNPGVVLVGSTGGLIYRSVNGGASWSPVRAGGADQEFRIIAQSPAASGTFYAFGSGYPPITSNLIGSGLVYVSTDDGVTWTRLAHQPPVVATAYRGAGRGIVIDKTGQIIVLSDAYGGIYRSTDSGASWASIEPGNKIAVYGLAHDPGSPNTLYSTGHTRGVSPEKSLFLKSTDFGASWTVSSPPQLNIGSNPNGYAVAVQPGTGTVFASYAGFDATTGAEIGGVARSRDGGQTWSTINTGIAATFNPGSAAGGIVFDPVTSSRIYLSTNGNSQLGDGTGFFISTDNGNHWVASGNSIPQNGGFVVAARPAMAGYPAAIFVGDPDIAISTNGGVSWTPSMQGFANGPAGLVTDTGSSGGLYAGGVTGIFTSGNNGLSWRATAALPGSHAVGALAVDLTRTSHPVYAATLSKLFRSINGGQTWTAVQPHLATGHFLFGVFTDAAGHVFTLDNGHTLYRSSNAGASWTAIALGGATDTFGYETPIVLADAPAGSAAAGLMYANLSSGLWVSGDYGTSWALSATQVPAPSAAILNMAELHTSPYTLFVNTNASASLALLPGASAFTAPAAATSSASYDFPLFVTAPGKAFAVNGYQSSVVIGSTDGFATSVNAAASLAGFDSHVAASISLTDTRLFVSDYDGSTFARSF